MKYSQIFLFSFICMTFSSVVVFAHSGRIDEDGGHHDYKNVSGLGNYHYHHGYPAHLHQENICPYNRNINEQIEYFTEQLECKNKIIGMSLHIIKYVLTFPEFTKYH